MTKNLTIILILLYLIASCSTHEIETTDNNLIKSQLEPSEILFEVKTSDPSYLEIFSDGIIPWISLQNASIEVDNLIGKNDIVLSSPKAIIIIDYPVSAPFEIEIHSNNPKGFTKAELILKISAEYKRIYKEEEESASTKTIPIEDRKGLINRNETDGKYGIWGHDLIDLDLSSIIVHKEKNKTPKLELYIES